MDLSSQLLMDMAHASDTSAVNTSGQEKVFLRSISDHKGIIAKVVRLYVDHPEDQKDLFQEVVLQAWRSYERFAGNAKFSTWLYRVALNTVLTYRRKETRRPQMQSTDNIEVPLAPKERSERSELLWLAIRELNQIDRLVIALHLDGYPNEEIAEITGMSKNNATVKLHRIKQRIVKKLGM
ncbi:MAG: sigma-70 family RNA polymerase sigma factor [Bacteroidota bacterium]